MGYVKAKPHTLTVDRLRSLFSYRDDGVLVRKHSGKGRKAGPVGSKCGPGYLSVNVDGRKHMVHRLVFMYHHGYMPDEVDHINGIRSDNRIDNLRAATHVQNCYNSVKRTDVKSQYRGVYETVPNAKGDRKWKASIYVNKSHMRLGVFDTPEAGAYAYDLAAYMHFGEYAKLNFPVFEGVTL